jgi:hypothetical protein
MILSITTLYRVPLYLFNAELNAVIVGVVMLGVTKLNVMALSIYQLPFSAVKFWIFRHSFQISSGLYYKCLQS